VSDSTYDHFEHPDVVAEYASFEFLFGSERRLLAELDAEPARGAVLDVGVGGGRTTEGLAQRARSYVGVDVSAPMVEACRRRFDGAALPLHFAVADARRLPFDAATFDLILFSFNGLDVVGGDGDRARVLLELRRVGRPGARIAFSSSNFGFAIDQLSYVRQVRLAAQDRSGARIIRRLRAIRRARSWNQELRRLRRAPHAVIVEERGRYELHPERFAAPGERVRVGRYHVRPSAQVEHLRASGFGPVRILAPDGDEVTGASDAHLRGYPWLYYLTTTRGGRTCP